MGLKLWKLERTDRIGYDEYIGDVVCAETEEKAIKLSHVGWSSKVNVSLIGDAVDGLEAGIVLDSFNAG